MKFIFFQFLSSRKLLHIFKTDLTAAQPVEIKCFTFFKDHNSSLQVNLVFVESTRFWSIHQAAFNSQNEFKPWHFVIDVFNKIIEQFHKTHFWSVVGCIVVKCGSVQIGIIVRIESLNINLNNFRVLTYLTSWLVHANPSSVAMLFLISYLSFFLKKN